MSFDLEILDIFKLKVLSLGDEFTKRLGRYQIVKESPCDSNQTAADAIGRITNFFARPPQKSPCQYQFETLLKQINLVSKSNSKRYAELHAFAKLYQEYNTLKTDNPETLKEPIMVMLGFLLYRYYRILVSYEKSMVSHPLNSTLFCNIRIALGFNFAGETHTNFRNIERQVLDPVTVVEALLALRGKMNTVVNGGIPLYQTYPHLAKDNMFLSNIDKLIDEHTNHDKEKNINQYQAIRFITSLVLSVDEAHKEIGKAIDVWLAQFKQNNPAITHITSANIEEEPAAESKSEVHKTIASINLVSEHLLANTVLKYFKVLIPQLLNTTYIKDMLLKPLELSTFIEALKAAQLTWASYVVFGGIALLLGSNNSNNALKDTILQSVLKDTLTNNDSLTEQYLLAGIKRTIIFTDNNNIKDNLDCEFFINYNKFISELYAEQTKLIHKQSQHNTALAPK